LAKNAKNCDRNIDFRENRHFFAEIGKKPQKIMTVSSIFRENRHFSRRNWHKSPQKIMIIALAPGNTGSELQSRPHQSEESSCRAWPWEAPLLPRPGAGPLRISGTHYHPSLSSIIITHQYHPSLSPINVTHHYHPSLSPIIITHHYHPQFNHNFKPHGSFLKENSCFFLLRIKLQALEIRDH
jgi:hypothetical protein